MLDSILRLCRAISLWIFLIFFWCSKMFDSNLSIVLRAFWMRLFSSVERWFPFLISPLIVPWASLIISSSAKHCSSRFDLINSPIVVVYLFQQSSLLTFIFMISYFIWISFSRFDLLSNSLYLRYLLSISYLSPITLSNYSNSL